MIEKVKQTTSEKLLLTLFIILGIIAFYIFVILPQKCLFIKNYDPQEIRFDNQENPKITEILLNTPEGEIVKKADKYLAACDVPGIQKILPKEWRIFKEFEDIYKLRDYVSLKLSKLGI